MFHWLLGACLLLTMAGNTLAAELEFGFHPFLSADELMRRFTPLAEYLGQVAHQPVRIQITRDYQEHVDTVGTGKVDLAYLGPVQYAMVVDKYGQRPILGQLRVNGKNTFQGVLFTRTGSPLRNLADLKGKSFAFGDPNATMSNQIPKYMFLKQGIPLEQLGHTVEVGNHQNIALGVLTGNFDAGAVKEDIFLKYQPRGLQAVAWSPPIALHVVVASPHITPQLTTQWQTALANLENTPQGKTILQAIDPNATGMGAAVDSDFDNLREIMTFLKQNGITP